jgi:hypothetical protein
MQTKVTFTLFLHNKAQERICQVFDTAHKPMDLVGLSEVMRTNKEGAIGYLFKLGIFDSDVIQEVMKYIDKVADKISGPHYQIGVSITYSDYNLYVYESDAKILKDILLKRIENEIYDSIYHGIIQAFDEATSHIDPQDFPDKDQNKVLKEVLTKITNSIL